MSVQRLSAGIVLIALLAVSGCTRDTGHGPPTVHLGDDMCAECGMIISDERFACASIVEDEQARPETRLFDDFNCMINHETMNPGTPVLRRWVHDHATLAWLPAGEAAYLCSPNLQTPMASHVAAFTSRGGADSMQSDVGGDVRTFEAIRAAMALNGSCAGHPSREAAP